MTPEQAIAAVRARWAHPPLDPCDVEERIAIRFEGEGSWFVLATPPACRLFLPSLRTAGAWHSAYVHTVREVDEVLGRLLRARVVAGSAAA